MRRICILLILFLFGCANYRPLVDLRAGQTQQQYEADLSQCQSYAQQVAGTGTGAAIGAIAGALLGFAVNKAGGSNYDSGAGARIGGVLGAAGGAGAGAENEMNVIKRCMVGRGYSVLN